MNPTLAILTATELEQRPLRASLDHLSSRFSLVWHVGGMGAGATAESVMRLVHSHRPAWLVQAGIAGTLSEEVEVTESVLVASDYQADLGAWRPETERFEPFTVAESAVIRCPYTPPLETSFRTVAARSVNCACSPLIPPGEAMVETMEGAAFFRACQNEGVPFLQLRTISNRVGEPRDQWRIPEALDQLSQDLYRLVTLLSDYPL